MANVDNSQDILDSRDVIERIEELEAEKSALEDALSEAQEALREYEPPAEGEELATLQDAIDTAQAEVVAWAESDDARELKVLQALAEEGEGSPDWTDGETLIRDSYFQDYAEQLADDIGAIDRNANWPCNCIDWERAASELQNDYSSVDFDGVEYWIRS